jgi:hypothetical protein
MEGVCLLIVEQLLKANWELGIDSNCIMCDFWKKKKTIIQFMEDGYTYYYVDCGRNYEL